jgi:hypothetical protein
MDRGQPRCPQSPPKDDWLESELNYASLSNCQKTGEKLERDLKNSLTICAMLHKATTIYQSNAIFPKLVSHVNLGQMKKYRQNWKRTRVLVALATGIPQRITNAIMIKHLIKLTKY